MGTKCRRHGFARKYPRARPDHAPTPAGNASRRPLNQGDLANGVGWAITGESGPRVAGRRDWARAAFPGFGEVREQPHRAEHRRRAEAAADRARVQRRQAQDRRGHHDVTAENREGVATQPRKPGPRESARPAPGQRPASAATVTAIAAKSMTRSGPSFTLSFRKLSCASDHGDGASPCRTSASHRAAVTAATTSAVRGGGARSAPMNTPRTNSSCQAVRENAPELTGPASQGPSGANTWATAHRPKLPASHHARRPVACAARRPGSSAANTQYIGRMSSRPGR